MRRLMIFVIVLFSLFSTTESLAQQKQEDLYLKFESIDDRMWKIPSNSVGSDYSIFVFNIDYKNKIIHHIAFYEADSVAQRHLSDDDSILTEVKDVEWLSNFYIKYFNEFKGKYPGQNEDGTLRVFDLDKLFNQIFLIIRDPLNGKILCLEVEHDWYFSVD